MRQQSQAADYQFLRLCIGAGILPPRAINFAGERSFTDITGAVPSRPPKETSSPTFFPTAGMTLTAVVLVFATPIDISSAMIPQITSVVLLICVNAYLVNCKLKFLIWI